MANNKISGIYNLRSRVIGEYTFTGNDRDVAVSIAQQDLGLVSISNGHVIGESALVSFDKNKVVHVKNIRILTPGGEGLRTTRNIACLFNLCFIDSQNANIPASLIDILKFNECQPVYTYLRPYLIKSIGKKYTFSGGGVLHIEDYNIQTPYIGEKVSFYVEMQIETAGIIRDDQII